MYNNIGRKIKALAKVLAWIGIIASIVFGIAVTVEESDVAYLGFLIMPLGALVSWASSFTLYGFGELVENSAILVGKATEQSPANTNNP